MKSLRPWKGKKKCGLMAQRCEVQPINPYPTHCGIIGLRGKIAAMQGLRFPQLICAAACLACTPHFAQNILLNDTFSDSERSTQNLPATAAWYLLNDNAVMPAATVNAEGELAWTDKGGTYSGLIAFFTPEAQAQSLAIGDSLKLEFRIALDNLASAERVIRIGLMNSGGRRINADSLQNGATGLAVGTTFNNWRGYALLTAADASPVTGFHYIVERTGVNSALWSSGAYTLLGNRADTASFLEFEFVPVEITITRRAAEIEIIGRIGDVTHGPVVDPSGHVTTFDTIALFVQPQITGLRLDDVKVTFTPAATVDDPNLVVVSDNIFGRLPIDAPSPRAQVLIHNSGATEPLTILGATTLGGPDVTHYSLVTPLPITIAPGATGVVEVAFNPLGRFGDFVGTLELRSDDPGESLVPVTLDARYFSSGDQLLANPGFDLEDTFTNWAQFGSVAEAPGLVTNSAKSAALTQTGRLGFTDLVTPGDFQLDFLFAAPDSPAEVFELLLKTFPGFDRGNPFFDLRYAAGQFNVLSNGVWSDDIGLGTLEFSADANFDGDLDDPEDTRKVYRMQLTARGWGGDNPTYDLALSEPNSMDLTRKVEGLTAFAGGGGGGAAPPSSIIFSAENNPGYWLDQVQLTAGVPGPATFAITGITRNPNESVTITWESEAGVSYDVETTAALGSAWTTLSPTVTGNAGTTSFTSNAPERVRFYRVLRRAAAAP